MNYANVINAQPLDMIENFQKLESYKQSIGHNKMAK
jgi:hypothetical protein